MFEFSSSAVSGCVLDAGYVDLDRVAEPSDAELFEIEAVSAVSDAEVLAVDAEAALMVAIDELAARRAAIHVARFEASDDGFGAVA